MPISEKKIQKFRDMLLAWAEENLINYPWRENRTPYRVLISEIFLTRTKAAQVEPVYSEFIKIYPTLKDFLNLNLNKVKRIIKSLGLLNRAEVLKEISNTLKKDYNGKIPNTISELKLLKGIGDYGAGAILCFGFGIRSPILDSNFIRIYERVFNIKPKTKTAKTDKYLWECAEKILPDENFVNFNYAVLDLGGNICLPRGPKCDDCLINSLCLYFKKS